MLKSPIFLKLNPLKLTWKTVSPIDPLQYEGEHSFKRAFRRIS